MHDVLKLFPDFDSKRLVEWQDKRYLKKLINKWYVFADEPIDDYFLYLVSNRIYQPSYVSLETALAYYHFIPEAVYTIIAITTNKTIRYSTVIGAFNYRSVKPALYFGYRIHKKTDLPVLIAEPEKAVLDYLYLNSHIRTMADLEGLRFNAEEIKNTVDMQKLLQYSDLYQSATLNKKIKLFKKLIYAGAYGN